VSNDVSNVSNDVSNGSKEPLTGTYHRGRLTEEIYVSLIGVGRAVDLVVVTPEDVDRYRESPALVIAPALREGRVIYAA
jgi:hypothetical protein